MCKETFSGRLILFVLLEFFSAGGIGLEKIYVLDTNVLLQDPHSIFAFEENEVVIPAVVLEEVDSKKRNLDEVGRNARQISKIIDNLRKLGKLHEKIPLHNGGSLRIELNHKYFHELQEIFFEKTNDNRILAVAKNLSLAEQTAGSKKTVILVSKDTLVRVKADAIGLLAEDYLNDRVVEVDHIYSGFIEVFVKDEIIKTFYEDGELSVDQIGNQPVYPNQFVLMKDELGTKMSAIGIVNPEAKALRKLIFDLF